MRITCPDGTKCLPAGYCQWASTINIQLTVLVYYKVDIIIISLNVAFSRHDVAWKLLIWRKITITHSLTHSLTMFTYSRYSILYSFYVVNRTYILLYCVYLAAGIHAECELGWEHFQNSCYLFGTDKLNWFDASVNIHIHIFLYLLCIDYLFIWFYIHITPHQFDIKRAISLVRSPIASNQKLWKCYLLLRRCSFDIYLTGRR